MQKNLAPIILAWLMFWLASAASDGWQLQCRLREQMLKFLRDTEAGAWLPRQRLALDTGAAKT